INFTNSQIIPLSLHDALPILVTLLLNSQKIIQIIAAVTPYLLAIIFILLIFSIFTMDITWTEANEMAKEQPAAASNWVLGAFLRSEEHTSELQSRFDLVCRLL